MRPRIMQQAVRHKASSRTPPSPLFLTRLQHPGSGMQKVVLWHVVLCACLLHTRHRLSDTPKRSSSRGRRLLRQRVMRRPIMQQAVRHKSSSRKPPSPLFPTMLEHPESGMQSVLLWHVLLRACFSNSSPPLTHTAPPKLSSPRGRMASASARHVATHHAAGRQIQGFLTHTSITPLPHQARASRVWHAKYSSMTCRFACLLVSHITTAKTHCSTQALFAQGSKGFCVCASCGDPSCSRPSDTRLPHTHLHHPSSLPPSSIPTLACKK